jgi:hypothetical protein
MNDFVYAGCLYRTHDKMVAAAIEDWVIAGGLNNRATVSEMLASATDADLAAELIASGWEIKGATQADIEGAIADFRADFAA